MSTSYQQWRTRVRYHMRDRDPSRYAFSTPEVEREMEAVLRALSGPSGLGTGQNWTTLAVTAATDTYDMPDSEMYRQVLAIRRDDGLPLEILTREQFDRWREGESSTSHSSGRPERATLYEVPSVTTTAPKLVVQFHPWPDRSETLDILRSLVPSSLGSDTHLLPFDDIGCEALAYKVAANLLAGTDDETLARLKLTRAVAGLYASEADRLVRESRIRRANMRAASRLVRNRS